MIGLVHRYLIMTISFDIWGNWKFEECVIKESTNNRDGKWRCDRGDKEVKILQIWW